MARLFIIVAGAGGAPTEGILEWVQPFGQQQALVGVRKACTRRPVEVQDEAAVATPEDEVDLPVAAHGLPQPGDALKRSLRSVRTLLGDSGSQRSGEIVCMLGGHPQVETSPASRSRGHTGEVPARVWRIRCASARQHGQEPLLQVLLPEASGRDSLLVLGPRSGTCCF
ncbi:hypothetical protein OG613_48635 (plasmid) [Streptomyces sp. NBC_00015]|uniref:hypothetical protein n=1 Tax=Streptomyces sp. NBC_00015 TaxID=2903611 RepID=UPI00325479E1